MKSFRQFITEYDQQTGREDPMTGRPESVYMGDHTDLDDHELSQKQKNHRNEIQHHFEGDFDTFEAHVDKGIGSGHDTDTILDNHPVSSGMNDPKHPDHHVLYRNERNLEGYVDTTREIASRA